MTLRTPLVLADDGLIEQLQVGDTTPETLAAAQLLVQNNAIIRLLVMIALEVDVSEAPLSDRDVERFVLEISQ